MASIAVSHRQKLALLSALLLAGCLGYIIGRLVTLHMPYDSISTAKDERSTVPVVTIDGVREGRIVGSVDGDVRFFLGEEQVFTHENNDFTVPADILLTNEIAVLIPEWAQFVASKNGTKYYPVLSSNGSRISPRNRLYFKSAAEAESQGYKK